MIERDLGSGQRTHVCVVGSGPAGMVTALELADMGCRVTLVESGHLVPSADAQALSDADLAFPGTHAPMEDAVHRRWGGTAHLWGGRCVPYDDIDFESRAHAPLGAWPISFDSLKLHFSKACQYADCGDAVFSMVEARPQAHRPLSEFFVEGSVSASRLERWSAIPVMSKRLGPLIERHPLIQHFTSLTCTHIKASGDGQSAACVVLQPTTGTGANPVRVAADFFVLACGGVETTRLLLHAHRAAMGIRVEGYSNLGRYYMGHLSGKIANIKLRGDPNRTIYQFEKLGDHGDHYGRRRLTLTNKALRTHHLQNIAFWLDNPPPADPVHGSGILSAAYLAMMIPWLRNRLAPAAIRKALVGSAQRPRYLSHIFNIIKSFPSTTIFVFRFLYLRYLATPRLPGFFVFSPANIYALHYHAEHSPNAESRIELSEQTDALGMPRAKIYLRFSKRDAESVVAAHRVLDAHLRQHKIGELVYWYPPEERVDAVMQQARDGFHQIGSTRMGNTADDGVTDSFGKVFGVRNLFVCSSSVFPTSGQANPTLTLLAFAIHQAAHIAEIGRVQNGEA